MRIINNPNPIEEKVVVCQKCQCEFAYNKSDKKSYNNGVLGPGFTSCSWVNCPNCGEVIYDGSNKSSSEIILEPIKGIEEELQRP
jgi:hypothetical protein